MRDHAISDTTIVRHIDALLRAFAAGNRAFFEFWGALPTESALSEAGWTYFRDGHLRLRGDQLELVGDDLRDQGIARRQNQRLVRLYRSMQDAGAIDPFFSMVE
jgi:hypothetical protein